MKENLFKYGSSLIIIILVLLCFSISNVHAISFPLKYNFVSTIYYTSDMTLMDAINVAKPYLLTKDSNFCNENYDVIVKYNNDTKRYYYDVKHPDGQQVTYYSSPIPIDSKCGSYVMCLDFDKTTQMPIYSTIFVNKLNKGKKVSDCFIEGWCIEHGHLFAPVIDDLLVASPKDNLVQQNCTYKPFTASDKITFNYIAIDKNLAPDTNSKIPLFDKTNLLSLKSFVGTPIGVTLVSVSSVVSLLLLYRLIKFLVEFFNWLRPKEDK